MIDTVASRQAAPTLAMAMGAAIVAGQAQYPFREEPYRIVQEAGTYSEFIESMEAGRVVQAQFASSIASMFAAFAARQEPLGHEFQAAIFDDIEGLYEA